MLKYQEALTKFIEESTILSIPHSLILIGKKGCGKHLFINDLSDHLRIEALDITKTFDDDLLNEIQCKPIPKIYYLDIDLLDNRKQNGLLKFFEEPLTNAIIILISTSKEYIIDTLLNRGRILTFNAYSPRFLEEFLACDEHEKSWILSLCETPGEVITCCNSKIPVSKISELCDKIITKISGATLPNTLSIIHKINFGDESDRIDFDLFCKVLLQRASWYVHDNEDIKYREIYRLVNDLYNDKFIHHIDKKQLLQTFLINLKYMGLS